MEIALAKCLLLNPKRASQSGLGKQPRVLPCLSETSPTAAEVTSMAPTVTPPRTRVRIYWSCRINTRCRIHRIFINHHWRRRHNDRPANYDGLGNDGSRLLDYNTRRSPILIRGPLIAWNLRNYRQIGGHCRRGKSKCTCCTQDRFTHGRCSLLCFPCLSQLMASKTPEPIVRSTTGSRLSRRLIERSSIFGTCGCYRYLILALAGTLAGTKRPSIAICAPHLCCWFAGGSRPTAPSPKVVAGVAASPSRRPLVNV
jgi:hypothetical protein